MLRVQGCCEHLLTISDVRMLHADDARARASYPRLTFESYKRRRRCGICSSRLAAKVRRLALSGDLPSPWEPPAHLWP